MSDLGSFLPPPSSFIPSPACRADDVFAELGRGGSEAWTSVLLESRVTDVLGVAASEEIRRGDLRSGVSAGSETRAEQTRAEPRRSRVQRYERELDECYGHFAVVGEDAQ